MREAAWRGARILVEDEHGEVVRRVGRPVVGMRGCLSHPDDAGGGSIGDILAYEDA